MTQDLTQVPVLILAGGFGTRLGEETDRVPKPMVEIGGIPILVHIMQSYYSYGFNDFVICAGYRSWEIKQYFLSEEFRKGHLEIDHRTSFSGAPKARGDRLCREGWRIRVIDTGLETMTGARVARALNELDPADKDFEDFAVTYGDGLCSVNLAKEFVFHKEHGKIGTVLGVQQPNRFGQLKSDAIDHTVLEFQEKPIGFINGGYFFFRREFRNHLTTNPACVLETEPLSKLVSKRELVMSPFTGFWQCMDTPRDKAQIQSLWDSGNPPWKRTDVYSPGPNDYGLDLNGPGGSVGSD